MKILVGLEFDEQKLGDKWMNPDNLDLLLYTKISTKKDLLKVISYQEGCSVANDENEEVKKNGIKKV